MVQVFEDAESQMVLGKAALQKDDDAAAQAHFASALQLLEAQGHPPFGMRRRFRLELAYCKSWARWAAEKASDEYKQRVRFIAAVEEAYERLKTADAMPVVLETRHAKAIHREFVAGRGRISCARPRSSVDGLLVAHQLEYDAWIILQELGRLPSMQSCRPLITALAARGICTMNASARRRGWKVRNTAAYYAMSLPGAFKFFVEPLGVSKWADTFHHDSRYDVAKTLELYDALYRSVP
eukprot:SAG25_NODE_4208_length_864_cov_1.499346_1_plen_238_part_10